MKPSPHSRLHFRAAPSAVLRLWQCFVFCVLGTTGHCASQTNGTARTATEVTQYGITWTFAQPVQIGRFVNGDFYVVGPVEVTGITPRPLWGTEVVDLINKEQVREDAFPGKQARNGSALNPPARSKTGGFDSRIPSGRYDPALFAHLPVHMQAGDALVSTISRPNSEITKFGGQHVDPLRVAAVLTCVAEPFPWDAFRPSYCDIHNSKVHLARNLKRNLLLNLPRVPHAPRTLGTYIDAFAKPWLDTVEFGFAAPRENLPHYGQLMAQVEGEAGLLLMMNYPAEEKERLLLNLVQVGIDFWGIARAGGTWPAHGGLHSGRKWPIVFAGLLLDDRDMQQIKINDGDLHFGEDDQTALCPYEYKGKVYERGWTGARALFTGHSLAGSGGDRGNWDRGWGPVDLFPPDQWPHRSGTDLPGSESYRRANTSAAWVGEALTLRLLHAESVWNHDAFFAYVDRWMTEDDQSFLSQIKAAGFQDLTRVQPGKFMREGFVWGPGFVREMWDVWRNHLPVANELKPALAGKVAK
jgi:hypothetical protein